MAFFVARPLGPIIIAEVGSFDRFSKIIHMINNGQALKTAFRGLQFIQSDQCWGSWSPFEGILMCWMLPPCLQEHWRTNN